MAEPSKGTGLPANLPLPNGDEPEDSRPRGLPAYHYTPPKVTQPPKTTPDTGSSKKTEYSEITQMILNLEGQGAPQSPSPSAPRLDMRARAAAAVQPDDQEEDQAKATVPAKIPDKGKQPAAPAVERSSETDAVSGLYRTPRPEQDPLLTVHETPGPLSRAVSRATSRFNTPALPASQQPIQHPLFSRSSEQDRPASTGNTPVLSEGPPPSPRPLYSSTLGRVVGPQPITSLPASGPAAGRLLGLRNPSLAQAVTLNQVVNPGFAVIHPGERDGNKPAVAEASGIRSRPSQASGVHNTAEQEQPNLSQDIVDAANFLTGFRKQQNAAKPLGRALSPRAPTQSPITPHHLPFINVQPTPLPDDAELDSHDDPNGALVRRLQTYQSFSTAGDFLADNIHPVDEALIAPLIHDTYLIKTVSTIKCDKCGVKLAAGAELYQCQTCSSQICQQCVEERFLRERADATRAAPGRGRAGPRNVSDDSAVSHTSAAADLDAKDIQDDSLLTNASAETGYTDVSATTGAKNDGMRPTYKFDWQGRRKHMPFKLRYLDRKNKIPANRGPWECDAIAPDYVDNLVRARVRFLAHTRGGKGNTGGKGKKGQHTRTFPGRRIVSEDADAMLSGRVKEKKKKPVTDRASPATRVAALIRTTANTMNAVPSGRPGTLTKLQRIQEMVRTGEQAPTPVRRTDMNDRGYGGVRRGNTWFGSPAEAQAFGGGSQQQQIPAAPARAPGLYAGFAPQEDGDTDSEDLYGDLVDEEDLDQEFELTEEGRRTFGAGHGFDVDEGVERTGDLDQLASAAVQRIGEVIGRPVQGQQAASGQGRNFEFVTHGHQQLPYQRQPATPITPQVPQLPRGMPYIGYPVTGYVPNTLHHRLNGANPNTPARHSANAYPTPETNNQQPRPSHLRGNEATHILQFPPPGLLPYIPLPSFPVGPHNAHPGVYLHETYFLPSFSSSTFIEQPPHTSGHGISTDILCAYLEFIEDAMADQDPNKTPSPAQAREILREAQGIRDEWEELYCSPRSSDNAPLLGVDDRPGALSRAAAPFTESRRLEREQNTTATTNPPMTLYSTIPGGTIEATAAAAPADVVRFANPDDRPTTLSAVSEPIIIDSDDDDDTEERIPLNVVRRAHPRPSRDTALARARPARAMRFRSPPFSRPSGARARSPLPAPRAAATGGLQRTPQTRLLAERLLPGYFDGNLTSDYGGPLNFAGVPVRYAYQGGYVAPWGYNEGVVVGAYRLGGRFVRAPGEADPEVSGIRRGGRSAGGAGGHVGGSAAVSGVGVGSAGPGLGGGAGAMTVAPSDHERLSVLAAAAAAVVADEAAVVGGAGGRPGSGSDLSRWDAEVLGGKEEMEGGKEGEGEEDEGAAPAKPGCLRSGKEFQ